MANRIKYGISSVYYAPITDLDTGTFGAPVAMPGAVSLTLEQQGEVYKSYADNIVWYQAAANNGYEGDLELRTIPETFYTDILGQSLEETDKVLVEKSTDSTKPFALLFKFNGDAANIDHVLYYCTATRPSIESTTVEDTVEVGSEIITISAAGLPSNGLVKAKSTPDTTSTITQKWYTEVYVPTGE